MVIVLLIDTGAKKAELNRALPRLIWNDFICGT